MSARFLEKNEYLKTKELAIECFGNEDGFFDDYYKPDAFIYSGRIAVRELDGKIVSMAHMVPMLARINDGKLSVTADNGKSSSAAAGSVTADAMAGGRYEGKVYYILCVATTGSERHHGYMDEVMELICETLKNEGFSWTFLVPVNKDIYRHLGFKYDIPFDPDCAELLCADDGLTECSIRQL